jgi:hypothetical protein
MIGQVQNFVFPLGTNTAASILVLYLSFGENLLPRHLNTGHKSHDAASHPPYELVMKAVGRKTFRYIISCTLLRSNPVRCNKYENRHKTNRFPQGIQILEIVRESKISNYTSVHFSFRNLSSSRTFLKTS